MKKSKTYTAHVAGPRKRTSIGKSKLSRPKNKSTRLRLGV